MGAWEAISVCAVFSLALLAKLQQLRHACLRHACLHSRELLVPLPPLRPGSQRAAVPHRASSRQAGTN